MAATGGPGEGVGGQDWPKVTGVTYPAAPSA